MKSFSMIACAFAAMTAAQSIAAEDPHLAMLGQSLEPTVQVHGRPAPRRTVAEVLAEHHTPAASVAVVDHGRVVLAKAWGFADVASHNPATPETIFQAGSISKSVTASAALQLVQDGKLQLDADVNAELRSWRVPPSPYSAVKPVTLRGLLTHTSGLTGGGLAGYAAGAPTPTLVQALEGKPPANNKPVIVEAVPGTRWRYSSGGIAVAQLMMTDATNESFPRLMRRRVLAPLGMRSSAFDQPLAPDRRDAATGYLIDGEPVVGRFHTYPEVGAAGLWTTPSDLAKWVIALESAYDGHSQTLMRQATARTMLTSGLGGWGLGVAVKGQGNSLRFEHEGDTIGFKAQMVGVLSGDRGVVVMTNGDDGMAVAQQLVQAVARAYGWEGFAAKVINEVPWSEAERAGLVGKYGKGRFTVTSEGGKLWAGIFDSRPVELVPTTPDRLVMLEVGLELRVVRNAKDAVTGVAVGDETYARD